MPPSSQGQAGRKIAVLCQTLILALAVLANAVKYLKYRKFRKKHQLEAQVLKLRFCLKHEKMVTRRVSERRVKIDFPLLTLRVTKRAQLQKSAASESVSQVGPHSACASGWYAFALALPRIACSVLLDILGGNNVPREQSASMQAVDPRNPFAENSPQPVRQRSTALWWVLGAGLGLVGVCCGGLFIGLAYIGVSGPETSVYTGNQVPEKFLATAREVGALDANEKVRFFYSDSLVDIREGFYFVSDKKVVIYHEDGRESPLIAIDFDEIEDVEIYRNESFFEDSEITIQTTSGEFVAFPVSSEFDRDQAFFEAIEAKTR